MQDIDPNFVHTRQANKELKTVNSITEKRRYTQTFEERERERDMRKSTTTFKHTCNNK